MKKYARSNRKQQRLQERRNWTIRVNGRGEPRPYNVVQAEYRALVAQHGPYYAAVYL